MNKFIVFFATALFAFSVFPVVAATKTWDGSANGNFSTAANWTGGVAPVNGDDLVFPASGVSRFSVTNNFIGGPRFRSITFGGSGFTLYGAFMVLSNGIGAQNITGVNRVNCAITLAASQTIFINGDTGALLDINGDVALGPYTHNISAGGGRLFLSGVISGTGGLTKISGGTVRLDGPDANTYSGLTKVRGGTLELSKGPSSGATAVPGDLILGTAGGGPGTQDEDVVRLLRNNQIASTSDVTISESGLLDLNGSSTTIGTLTMVGGRVDSGTGTLILNGDVTATSVFGSYATIMGNLSLGSVTRTFTVNHGVASPTMLILAAIGGAAGIVKAGDGELQLHGTNSYSGLTTVQHGLLLAHNDAALGLTSAGTVVNTGATLAFRSTQNGLEPLTLNGAGVESVFSPYGAGALLLGDPGSWAGPVALATDSFILVHSSPSPQAQLTGVISGPGGLTKIGAGTLIFGGSASNTYAGKTRVNEGTLLLRRTFFDRSIPGDLFIGDGVGVTASDVVRLENFAQINNLSTVTIASSGLLELTGTSESIGSLAGAGALHLASELEVGSDNTSTTFSGAITGASGELSKIGTGTLTLSGDSSHGLSRVHEGALVINGIHGGSVEVLAAASLGGNGTINSDLLMRGGMMAPGASPGRLRVNQDVEIATAPSVFRFELNGTGITLQDQLIVGNALNLAGISLDVIPGLAFPPGSQFLIIDKLGGPPAASPFDGLPEGATLNAGGQVFQITYRGGAGNNDVVLTRGASHISSGLRHTTLGHAKLMPGPAGSLNVGSIGSSGDDGVSIALREAQGWQGELTALDPGTGQGRLGWEIQGQRGNQPLQPVTRGYLEVANGEIRAFADSSPVGGTAHWVEVFAGEEFLKNALVPSNAPLFRLLPPFPNPPPMTLRCEGAFPGKPDWHCDISWPQPRRIVVPGADDSPLDGATRVRVKPWATQALANAGPPFALQLTAKNIPAIRISDEALLNPPTPADEGLPHRALGQTQFEARGGQLILMNIGSSGQDGVSIDVGGRSSGIGILTAPISLTPNGTMLALEAMGTFDGTPDRSMGTASLRTVGTIVQAMADFAPVGSAMVRVEVFRGSSQVGSALAPAGLVATIASPLGQGGAPSLDAVGWVPPCLLPVIDGIAQSAFEPLPCYFFHFDGLAAFTLQGSQQFVGDSLRLLTANDQPRAQSLARLDIRAALIAPDAGLALNVEKLRLPVPQITRVFPLQARSGEIVEILGRGFGRDPFDLRVVGSARIAGLDRLTVPFHVLSASDTRVLARVGPVPPGTPGGPIQVYRGVGNEGTPQGVAPDVEFTKPIRAWRESTPSGSFTLETVYEPPSLSAPPKECFQSGPPVQGVLYLYLYLWFPNAVVSFNSHVSAAFASGSTSVDAFGVRFLGNGDLLDGAQKLAKVLETAFAQQAGLIVNVEATRPQDGTVKLTLSLPNGFITGGFLNVCVQQGEIVPSVVDFYPLVVTDGNLITINGQGFGDDTRDLRVGVRDTNGAVFFPMEVLRANDTQILARMGAVPAGFSRGPVEVRRGEGYRITAAAPGFAGFHEIWQGHAVAGAASDIELEFHVAPTCFYSEGNLSIFPDSQGLGIVDAPFVILPATGPSPASATINALVLTVGTNYVLSVETTVDLTDQLSFPLQVANALRQTVEDQTGFDVSVTIDQVTEGFRLIAYISASQPAALKSFSVCVRSSTRDIELARVTTEGGFAKITGSGFGNQAEDLSVAILDDGGARLIPLEVLAASNTEITARMGTVPPGARPGPLVVHRGKGSFNSPQPFFEAVDIGPRTFTWFQPPGTGAPLSEVIIPLPTIQPEPGRQWFFSEPPNSGELSVVLGGDWPNTAVVSIAAGIHDANGAACELSVPGARFAQAGNPVDCAERIADVIRSALWQQAARAVDVKVTPLPGGQVKLSLSLCDGLIARGFVTVCVTEPPLVSSVETPSGGSGDVVTIRGRGFGTNAGNLLVYAQGSNGVQTLLQVLSATETRIVARVGAVRPDAQSGPIVVARGEGRPFQKNVPGLEVQQFVPAGEVFAASKEPFNPIQPAATSTNVCFYSVATNGVICVEVAGNWPPNVRVLLEFQFYSEGSLPPPPGGVFGTAFTGYIDLPGGAGQQCAQAICAAFDGTHYDFPIGTLHCALTQTGANRFKLTFSGDVPISGHFNICHRRSDTLMLGVRLMNGAIEISWTGVAVLEEASDPAGPWQDVQPPPTGNLHVEPALAQTKFYRLRKQ